MAIERKRVARSEAAEVLGIEEPVAAAPLEEPEVEVTYSQVNVKVDDRDLDALKRAIGWQTVMGGDKITLVSIVRDAIKRTTEEIYAAHGRPPGA